MKMSSLISLIIILLIISFIMGITEKPRNYYTRSHDTDSAIKLSKKAPPSQGLDKNNKEILKELSGSASPKVIDFNKIRDEYRP